MRSALLTALAIIPLTTPAFATGSIFCEGSAGETSFRLSSGVTHGMGNPLFGLGAELATGFENISPDLRDVEFGGGHLVQWWQDGEELNLLLYVERAEGDSASTQLTIKTRRIEEGIYEGEFQVDSFEWPADMSEAIIGEASGKARCMSE